LPTTKLPTLIVTSPPVSGGGLFGGSGRAPPGREGAQPVGRAKPRGGWNPRTAGAAESRPHLTRRHTGERWRRLRAPNDIHRIREGERRHRHERNHVVHAPIASGDHLDPAVAFADGEVEVAIEANRARLRLLERAFFRTQSRRPRRDAERLHDAP